MTWNLIKFNGIQDHTQLDIFEILKTKRYVLNAKGNLGTQK